MTRLPAVGGDYDSWGTILNDFLSTTIDVYALATAASPGDGSVTLDRVPFGISKGAGFLIIDPFSTSCEVRLVSSVSNATVTLVRPVTVSSSAISFDSATKQIRSTTETVSKFFPGARIAVTGSSSNNGFYTIDDYPADGSYDGTYITVNENLVNESVGAAVTIVMDLNRAHVAGTRVFFAQGPIQAMWYGVKATGDTADATNNRLGLQRMLDDSYYASANDLYLPGFLQGRYVIDGPLYLEKLSHLRGPHHKSAVIAAHSTFPTWNEDVAIIQTRRNGLVCKAENGGNDRYYMSGIGIDGLNVAYAKSTGYSGSSSDGTGYVQSGTKTFSIHATLTDGNRGICYRALAGGTGGNAIRVAHVNDGANQSLSVTVSGNDITVHLATNGSSVVTSTIADVVAAVNADAEANVLVEATLYPGYDLGVGTWLGTNLASTLTMTQLTAGTAPFAAGDVGRSIDIATGGVSRGAGAGSRKIAAYTNAYTVTVDGDNFLKTYAGLRFAVSGINGLLGSFNQTCRFDDMRIESCPGYAFAATGSQEFSVRNLMTLFSGIHIRLLAGNQFAHFIDVNMEHTGDAYVSIEATGESAINRSIHFVGGHIEDTGMCDYFRANTPSYKFSNFQVYEFQATSNGWTTVLYANTNSNPSTYGFIGWEWSGPNAGPLFINDVDRGLQVPMTAFEGGATFYVAQWAPAGGGETITPRWVRSKSTTYQMVVTDKLVLANATGAPFTVTLPSAVGLDGMEFTVKRVNSGGNAVSVDGSGAETIDGSGTPVSLGAQYDRITVMSDGTAWHMVD